LAEKHLTISGEIAASCTNNFLTKSAAKLNLEPTSERGTMRRSKRLTAFLILVLLLSTFAAVLHHHDTAADDHDCSICLVRHHQHAAGQKTVAFDGVPYFTETIYSAPASVITKKIFVSSLKNRAPPA
jgi:hypothetical protein